MLTPLKYLENKHLTFKLTTGILNQMLCFTQNMKQSIIKTLLVMTPVSWSGMPVHYTHIIDIIPFSHCGWRADAGSWAAGHDIQIPEYKSGHCS